jgi:hypothetical protein
MTTSFYRDHRRLGLSDSLDPPPLTVTRVDRTKYPEKSFPGGDFAYRFDQAPFADHLLPDDFPVAIDQSHPRTRHNNARVRDLVNDVSRHLTGPLGDLIPFVPPDYQEPDRRAFFRFPNTEEEDANSDGGHGEEEDFGQIYESREAFEENMSPEHEEIVARLMALGFDRNMITPVMLMSQGNEAVAREFLVRAIESMP